MGLEAVECLLLAGAPADELLKERYNVTWRAEAPIAGKRMVDWVVEALRRSGAGHRIIAVSAFDCGADETLSPASSFVDNVMLGAAKARGDTILVASSDIPLAPPDAYAELIRNGTAEKADFVYPIVRKEDALGRYPELKRTYVRVKEGTFTGGNAVLVRREFLLGARERLQSLYRSRKRPLKLASMIGIGSLARVLMAQKIWPGAAGICALEHAAGRVMGGRLKAVISSWPELGEDIDSADDIPLAEAALLRGVRDEGAASPEF